LVFRVLQNLISLRGNRIAALSDNQGQIMKIKKTVTAAKQAANKTNAQASTGPRTPRGIGHSSQSAITRGMFTRDMLLPGENERDFRNMLHQMVIDRCPVGDREFHQVEIIAWHRWRYRRYCLAETAEITIAMTAWRPGTETVAALDAEKRTMAEVARIEQIEVEIEVEARVSGDNINWLQTLNYGAPVRTLLESIGCCENESEARSRPSFDVPPAQERHATDAENSSALALEGEKNFARMLLGSAANSLKEFIQEQQVYYFQQRIKGESSQLNTLMVLPEASLNRFTGYEDHLLKKITNAEHELERMQRLRMGHKVPPPSARID
jgi:hypothetical protein